MHNLSKILKRHVFNNRLKSIAQFAPLKTQKYPPEIFTEIYNNKIHTLQSAFLKLQEFDTIISHVGLSNYNNTLIIELQNIGVYKIWVDSSECLLYFFSPNSGNFTYYYNKEENQWTNIKDGHIFEDFLVRELLKFTKGYLDI